MSTDFRDLEDLNPGETAASELRDVVGDVVRAMRGINPFPPSCDPLETLEMALEIYDYRLTQGKP